MKIKIGGKTSLILTITSIIGFGVTTVLTAKETIDNQKKIKELEVEKGESLTKKETVAASVMTYLPAIISGGLTVTSICGIHVFNRKKQASLSSAFSLIASDYMLYKKSNIEANGKEADAKAVMESCESKLKVSCEIPIEPFVHNGMYETYDGSKNNDEKHLFYDVFSQRYFKSKWATVLNAQYHVNRMLQLEGWVPINELYEFLGLKKVEGGNMIGWDAGYMVEEYGIVPWIEFNNYSSKSDEELEYIVIDYVFTPAPLEEAYIMI